MAALDWQTDNVISEETCGDSRDKLQNKKFGRPNYFKGKFGESEYKKACGYIAVLLESKKITVRQARSLLAQAETKLRVYRPAVSMEVTIAAGQGKDNKLKVVKDKAIKSMGRKSDFQNSCIGGGHKTCNFRVKVKGKGRDLI